MGLANPLGLPNRLLSSTGFHPLALIRSNPRGYANRLGWAELHRAAQLHTEERTHTGIHTQIRYIYIRIYTYYIFREG
jgi:hypothetical protein